MKIICKNCKKPKYSRPSRVLQFCSRKCYFAWNQGENHPNWVGNRVGYFGVHSWIERVAGKPRKCEDCGTVKAKRFEWANLSGKYQRKRSDWKRLCSPCHHKLDDITNRGWATRKAALCV